MLFYTLSSILGSFFALFNTLSGCFIHSSTPYQDGSYKLRLVQTSGKTMKGVLKVKTGKTKVDRDSSFGTSLDGVRLFHQCVSEVVMQKFAPNCGHA